MSAIDIIVQSNAVHLISDGACIGQDGIIHFIAGKVLPLPHLNAVIAHRGPSMAGAMIAPVLGSCGTTYDEVKANAARTCQAAVEQIAPLLAAAPMATSIDFVIAGWSESTGPDAYALTSDGKFGEAPWSLLQLSGLCSLPGDSDVVASLSLPAGATADDLDPERDGWTMLQAKRAKREKYFVGCFGQLTSIHKGHIVTKIIGTWPEDVFGTRLGTPPGIA